MADVYEVVSLAKIEDAASGGDEVQVTLRRKWAEQDDGSYAPQVETASGGVASTVDQGDAGAEAWPVELSGDLPDTAALLFRTPVG